MADDSGARVRIALCRALAELDRMQESGIDGVTARGVLSRMQGILQAPAVTEALRTVVTRDGAVLAVAVEECLGLLKSNDVSPGR